MPVVLPIAVAMLIWAQLMYNPEIGYMDSILRPLLGLRQGIGWLNNPRLTMPSIAMASLWKGLGTPFVLYLIGIYNIPGELFEAATIDGAGSMQQLWHITLPLLKPMMTVVMVLSVGVLGITQQPMLFYGMTGTGPEGAAFTTGFYSYVTAFVVGSMRWGYAAAMSLTIGLLSMVLSAVIFKAFRSERMF